MATNNETFQSAILPQCAKTLPCKRKKRTFTGCYLVETERLPTLLRICINSELYAVKKKHGLQHGDCSNVRMLRMVMSVLQDT